MKILDVDLVVYLPTSIYVHFPCKFCPAVPKATLGEAKTKIALLVDAVAYSYMICFILNLC